MKKAKILALCLLTLALVVLLASCGGEKTPAVTEPSVTEPAETTEEPIQTQPTVETEAPKAQKTVSRESLAEYTVIAPMVEGYLYNNAISLIYQSFSEKYGITVKMSDDFLLGDAKPSGKEIVIGNANRDFVTDEFLPYDGYHIYMSGDNIVLNGGSPAAVEEAAAHFVTLFEDGGIVMNEEGYLKASVYPLGNLKINGTPINEYNIMVEGTTYGAKYAAERLQKLLREQTGFELKINTGKAQKSFYLESINSEDGMYHIDVDEKGITLYGAGLSGAYTAVNALLEMIGDCEDVTVESASAPMLVLNNTKKKLEEGALSIGYMGDSIMAASGFKSYTLFITEHFEEAYPDAKITMKNHSQGGRNTTWGLYTMEDNLLSDDYDDLIFISLGTNDVPYGNYYDQIALNYQSMIEKIYRNDPDTDIVFVSHGREGEMKNIMSGKSVDFLKAMLDIANYYDIPVVDNIYTLSNLCKDNYEETWAYYISDTVHPNTEGQKLYADTVWQSISVALANSDSSAYASHALPSEPMYENSKLDAVQYAWSTVASNIKFGTGEEAGWGQNGTVSKSGASISYDFEGIGLELGIAQNLKNAYFLHIEIYNEQGELAFEEERDTGYYYHLFITNSLEYGKYTVKLTVTKPSEKYPSEDPTFTLVDVKIIK